MSLLPPCAHIAEQAYGTSIAVLETVASHAGGGIGPMGIQPGWLPLLARVGFDPALVRSDACMNIAAGAWIVAWASAHKKTGADPAAPSTAVPFERPATLPVSTAACVPAAARRYHLPEVLFRAILMTEGGTAGRISWNRNGTYDMGPAQVNSSWLPKLAAMGITRDQVINDSCINIDVGAWILAQAMDGATTADPGEFWRHVGNYNSATPKYNQAYQVKVWRNVRIASRSHGDDGS